MSGEEVRRALKERQINLSWLATQLNITPQALNTRLNARDFKQAYLLEITEVLQMNIFELPERNSAQAIVNISVCEDLSKGIERLPSLEFVNIPAFKNCIGFTFYEKSAIPKYDKGDVLFVTKANAIEQSKNYLLITTKGKFVRCVASEENNVYLLMPISGNYKRFPVVEISKDEILHAYRIVGAITREE